MAESEVRSVTVRFGADMSEYQMVANKVEESVAGLPSRLERKMSYSRRGNKVADMIGLPNENDIDKYAQGLADKFSSSFTKARARKRGPAGSPFLEYSANLSLLGAVGAEPSAQNTAKTKKAVDNIFDAIIAGVEGKADRAAKEARKMAMQASSDDRALGRSVYKYVKRDYLAEGAYNARETRSNMDWLDRQDDMMGIGPDASRRKRQRQLSGLRRRRQRERRAVVDAAKAEKARGREARKNARERERTARRRSQLMYQGGTGLFSFMGATAGSLAGSTVGGGAGTIIGRGMMGGGLGASIGMMAGGPLGALGGGLAGAAAGGMFGMVEAAVRGVMELFVGGISRAMSLLHMGASRVIELGMEYERTLAKFGILAGGADKGRALFGGIEQLSTRTPYRTSTLSSGAELLLGYGVKTDNIVPALSKLGDIAGGDATRFDRLALAFGQVISQGRLLGQELRQFSEAGVGAKDFADTLGISVFQLRAKMEAGVVPATVMVDTINRLTEGTGRFAGVNDATFKTVSGQWNSLVGTAEMIGRRVGESLFKKLDIAGMLGEGKQALTEFMSGGGLERFTTTIADWAKGIKEFGINLYTHAMPGLEMAVKLGSDFAKSFLGVSEGFDKAGMSWKTFEKGLLDGVKLIADGFITFARLMKALLPVAIDTGVGTAQTAADINELGTAKGLGKAFFNWLSPPKGSGFGQALGENWGDSIFGSNNKIEGLKNAGEAAKRLIEGVDLDALQSRVDRTYSGIGSSIPSVSSQFRPRNDYERRLASGFESAGLTYYQGQWMKQSEAQNLVKAMRPDVGVITPNQRITTVPQLDPAIAKMVTAFETALKEGLTPFEKFRIEMERIATGRRFIDETGRPGIDRFTSRALSVQAYNELKKALPTEEFHLAPSAARDTAEAIKIATESVFDRGDRRTNEEEIRNNLDRIRQEAEKTAKSNQVIADYFERNPQPLLAVPTGFE